jgi:quercetin dioxygenase-like cupin family protein
MRGAQSVPLRLMVGREHGAPTFSMRLFEVEPGGNTLLHQHNYEHELMVLEGEAQIAGGVSGSTIRSLRPGDAAFVPANETHQIRNVSDGILRFVCIVPTHFDCGKNECDITPGS